jgi:hypothetical protein
MAGKRKRKTAKAKAAEAYEQAMIAEGSPAVLDLFGVGPTISEVIGRARKKPAAKGRRKVKRKAKAKTRIARTKKKVSRARKVVRAAKKKRAVRRGRRAR